MANKLFQNKTFVRKSTSARSRSANILDVVYMGTLVCATVSLALCKTIYCAHFLILEKFRNYLWLPSVIVCDVGFCLFLYYAFLTVQNQDTLKQSFSIAPNCCFFFLGLGLNVLTIVIATAESTTLLTTHAPIDWTLAIEVILRWEEFKQILASKTTSDADKKIGEKSFGLTEVIFLELLWTFLIVISLRLRNHKQRTTRTPEERIQKQCCCFGNTFKTRSTLLGLAFAYGGFVFFLRPTVPFRELSRTPFVTAFTGVAKGLYSFVEDRSDQKVYVANNIKKEMSIMKSDESSSEKGTNVVLIILEGIRNDIMPYDGESRWAQHMVLNQSLWNKITPFYSNWNKSPFTMHVPELKTASSYTHKSLVGIHCSAYAIPKAFTREHQYNIYHECLPHILRKHGYSSKFFKSVKSSYDNNRPLVDAMGFDGIFAKEDYEALHRPSNKWKESHQVGYLGYEDSIVMNDMMNWVDNQTNPFFLSYLSGVTHDPFNMPPGYMGRYPRFSEDNTINNYINEVIYLDEFLLNVTRAFEERKLMESTLFVFMGDHGLVTKGEGRNGAFTVYSQTTEEAFTVAATFHTRDRHLVNKIASNPHVDGNWSTLDVVPTILDILNITVQPLSATPQSLSSLSSSSLSDSGGQMNRTAFDGRSMLHPSGERLLMTLGHPGNRLVLRQGNYIQVLLNPPVAYDLASDPFQKFPWTPNDKSPSRGALSEWSKKAVEFLGIVRKDLQQSWDEGQRCNNCALSDLVHLDTLNDWSKH